MTSMDALTDRTLKKCSVCQQSKPRTEFHKDRTKRDGHCAACKVCARKVAKRWREENRERSDASVKAWQAANPERRKEMQRRYELKKQYGITPEQYDAMRAAQDGRCAVCRQVSETLVVDHNHETARVRGLLCLRCNSGIGMLDDDIERLEAALAYLRGHDGRT